jgi:FkbM family methyltransferase
MAIRSYSQSYQDKFLDKYVFNGRENGCFVEIGAYDGVMFSNSLFFEKHRNWKGICIEPLPEQFRKLEKARKCVCVHGCVTSDDGQATLLHVDGPAEMLSGIVGRFDDRHAERIDRELVFLGGKKVEVSVNSYKLSTLLDKNSIRHVDYCSIDVEGCELDILKTIDFDKYSFDAFTIENNYDEPDIEEFMSAKGYYLLGKLEVDQIYVKKKLNATYMRFLIKLYNKLRKKPKKYFYLKWFLM